MISTTYHLMKLRRGQLSLNEKQLNELKEKLPQLKTLDLIAPDLEELPDIWELGAQLTNLNLTLGPVESWPASFWKIGTLKNLKIIANQGLILPEKNPDLAFTHLEYLTLKNCQLPKIPEWVFRLSELKEASFQGNQLKELPERLGQLRKLKRLNLDDNQLKELPASLYELKSINHISVDKNPLSEQCKQKIYEAWNIVL